MDIHDKYQRKGFCTGPLGFPMEETAARALEPQIKQAEKDGFHYKRSFVSSQPKELQFQQELAVFWNERFSPLGSTKTNPVIERIVAKAFASR